MFHVKFVHCMLKKRQLATKSLMYPRLFNNMQSSTRFRRISIIEKFISTIEILNITLHIFHFKYTMHGKRCRYEKHIRPNRGPRARVMLAHRKSIHLILIWGPETKQRTQNFEI
jgi:alpha-glucosidase (family GH31 glycosyl hydrolase)